MNTTQKRTRTSIIDFVLLQCTDDNEAVYDLG